MNFLYSYWIGQYIIYHYNYHYIFLINQILILKLRVDSLILIMVMQRLGVLSSLKQAIFSTILFPLHL